MKKIIALLVAVGAAGMLSAQVHFGIGARGEFGLGLGSTVSELYNLMGDVSIQPHKSFIAGGAVVGRLTFDSVPGLFLQPEIGFSHNQVTMKTSYSDTDDGYRYHNGRYQDYTVKTEYEYEQSIGYNAIDIPIIVGYDFAMNGGLVVSPFAGFNLSIPVGSFSTSGGSYTETITTTYEDGSKETEKDNHSSGSGTSNVQSTLTPGVLVGFGVGYKFDDHNMIMGDLRYLLDFIATKENVLGLDILTRRGLILGVNYVYSF